MILPWGHTTRTRLPWAVTAVAAALLAGGVVVAYNLTPGRPAMAASEPATTTISVVAEPSADAADGWRPAF